jgi:hypothetical protein
VVDLAAVADAGVAVEAVSVLEVEQAFADPVKRDTVAAEEEVLELDHRARGFDVGVELRGFVGPPAGDAEASDRATSARRPRRGAS